MHELLHELLHKCGGIVFADVWGDLHICNCVRMQAPTVPSADAGAYAELQQRYDTLVSNANAADSTIENQRAGLQAAEVARQEVQAKFKELETKFNTLEKERDTWKKSCIQRTEELKALKEVCGE